MNIEWNVFSFLIHLHFNREKTLAAGNIWSTDQADTAIHFAEIGSALALDRGDDLPPLKPLSWYGDDNVYFHYKGGIYCVVSRDVIHTETEELMVVYRHLWPHDFTQVFARPQEMFDGNTEGGIRRFVPLPLMRVITIENMPLLERITGKAP